MRRYLFFILFIFSLFVVSNAKGPTLVNAFDIRISPNPANTFFNLLVDEDIDANEISISIFDIIGTELTNYTTSVVDNDTFRVNIPSFKSGMYIVKVKAPNLLKTERLIVDQNK